MLPVCGSYASLRSLLSQLSHVGFIYNIPPLGCTGSLCGGPFDPAAAWIIGGSDTVLSLKAGNYTAGALSPFPNAIVLVESATLLIGSILSHFFFFRIQDCLSHVHIGRRCECHRPGGERRRH